jgi:hypothetical protein
MAKTQIINPYIRFRRKAQGRYANRIASSVYGRGVSRDEAECFYVADVGMGVEPANLITICFNKDMENCGTGWTFKKNGVAFANVAAAVNADPACISFTADDGASVDSAGPDDTITASYTPGLCGAVDEDDCFLTELTDASVDNFIWGPIALRVGDVADNILVAYFDDPASVIGDAWSIERNALPELGFIPSIVNGNIQFALTTDVLPTDAMTLTQKEFDAPGARATDGRYCWQFYDAEVANAVGVEFWLTEASDAYLLESGTDRWALDG